MLTIVVTSVFEKDGKYYPQIFLDECLYKIQKCCSSIKNDISDGIDKWRMCQKNASFVIVGILRILVLNFNHRFVMVVMIY